MMYVVMDAKFVQIYDRKYYEFVHKSKNFKVVTET